MKTLQDLQSDVGTVVVFIQKECPYVEHILQPLIALAKTYPSKEISFIAIHSNVPMPIQQKR